MSSNSARDAVQPPESTPKAKKHKKKKGGAKNRVNGDNKAEETTPDAGELSDVADREEKDSRGDVNTQDTNGGDVETEHHIETQQRNQEPHSSKRPLDDTLSQSNEASTINGDMQVAPISDTSDPSSRFDALVKDRDNLREEVTKLRKSLEELQSRHDGEEGTAQEDLQEARNEKEEWENRYNELKDGLDAMRSRLAERFKAKTEELDEARNRIGELEDQSSELTQELSAKNAELATMAEEREQSAKELSSLRNRTTLSQQNWLKEREEMAEQESYLREDFENAKQAMHDWEVLALEERSMRRDLADKVGDLEEQVTSYKEAYDKASRESEGQSVAVEGLQKALQELQTERKRELREMVESSQAELEKLQISVREAEQASTLAKGELEKTKVELERAQPFEKEVKEKDLQLGKLRHQNVTLNEHLTNALRLIKHMKSRPEDNVDRQIITVYLLKFLTIDRSDPKKFEVLQLIADLLRWTDDEREQAGLLRSSSATASGVTSPSSSSLRLPSISMSHSPSMSMTRSGSTSAALASMSLMGEAGAAGTGRKETLGELFQTFLEEQAAVAERERRGTGSGQGAATVVSGSSGGGETESEGQK